MKGDHPIDNRDVVPYNACFSKRYQAHINVEVVASIKAVKYLYKYTYKGHDRAQVELGVDEIADYVDARYVGPCEACWRLFEFPMAGKSHSIERLDLISKRVSMLFLSRAMERMHLQRQRRNIRPSRLGSNSTSRTRSRPRCSTARSPNTTAGIAANACGLNGNATMPQLKSSVGSMVPVQRRTSATTFTWSPCTPVDPRLGKLSNRLMVNQPTHGRSRRKSLLPIRPCFVRFIEK